ncbi:MAG TPA: DUF1697 domain-containing protein [Pyrinomonadaceae bacterium]|nr:DUF1697 domain-containing protein [Pyrinomonadaceae bacterium]
MKSAPEKSIFVALLRGVNVGGNNMISMSSLKASFEKLGFKDVSTYINSGNILFRSKETDARKLEKNIEQMLSKEYKLDSKVVVKSYSEMAKLFGNMPKNWDGNKDYRFNVMFLRHTVDSEDIVKGLEPNQDIEEVVVYRPGALLWSSRLCDMNQTSMAKLGNKKPFQEVTVRNLNTTLKLYELMKKLAES